ncbi:MAG TPA: hypothetical protein VK363_11540 [Pyrinomonadaceae bacterium]|nr:hypothetical protein [Pyrinomonadaceae bacterium]
MKQRSGESSHAAARSERTGVRGHLARTLFCVAAALLMAASAGSAYAQEGELTADMSVEKTGPFEAVAGQNISYTITLTNIGTTDSNNVVLTDNIPANTTAVSFTQDSGTPAYTLAFPGGTAYTASAEVVHPGETATFTLTVTINSSAPPGSTITNTATVSSSPDADPSNNSSSSFTTVSTTADLGVSKSGPETANAGDSITYAISVFNNGSGDALNVTVTDQAPPGTSPQSFTQTSGPPFNISFNGVDTYTAQAASFPAGQIAVFEMVVQVNRNVLNGTVITNGVSVTSSTNDPDPTSNSATAGTTVTNTRHVVISEFRFRGEGGARDEFIEIYNDSNSPLTVQSTDESGGGEALVEGGWAIVASDNTARCLIPNNTVIPARGHYLCVNSASYSLNGYPAGTAINATGNTTYTTGIPDDGGIGLFSSQSIFNGATLLDSVGFSSVTNPLFREGTGLGLPVTTNAQFSFVRRLESGVPQDTNNNAQDFVLVATDPLTVGNGAQLGAPGPENTFSPTQRNATVKSSLIAPQQPVTASPNRARVGTPVPNGAYGTLSIRRRFTNSTGQTLTRLRFRAVNMTTLGTPVSLSPQADMRLITSGDFGITVNGNTLSVKGTVVEQPPAQPLGGGLNSTATVTLPGGGLAPGASVDVQFLLGVQQEGIFRFLINVEGLTNPPTLSDSANRKVTRGK